MTTIKTERLTLRPLRDSDAPELARLISEWNVIRWLTSPPWPYRVEDAINFIEDDMSNDARAITRDDQVMGVVGISPAEDYQFDELGYWLGIPFHGAGYMTEAAGALVDAHFQAGHDGLSSGYLLDNAASCNVLTKLGFEDVGQKTSVSRPLAAEVKLNEVRLTADAWRARREA